MVCVVGVERDGRDVLLFIFYYRIGVGKAKVAVVVVMRILWGVSITLYL